jgi:hyperosmotically inducible protein
MNVPMQTHSRPLLLKSGIALAILALSGAAAADTLSEDIVEARQESQIWTTFALNPHLRAADLKVSVNDGKATLSGKVEDGVSKDLAKQVALGVSGVKDVDNQIVVQPDYVAPVAAAERGYGEVIDDATITATVKSKLMWSKYTDGLKTEIETRRGKVTLSGTADSAPARDLAGRLAMNTRGVVAVDNRLTVTGAKPSVSTLVKSSAQDAGQGISDGWITTKVKSTLMYSNNVNSSNITVNTTGGVVTLSGKVSSAAEQALAVELAQNVRGVKAVQSAALVH